MINGIYSLDDIARIDYTNSRIDIQLHELIHSSLTQGSILGNTMIVLNILAKEVDIGLLNTIKVLIQSSELTQEMTALYFQAVYFRELGHSYEDIISYLSQSDYYKMYAISGFDDLVKNEPIIWGQNLAVFKIALDAMNFDISNTNPDWTNAGRIIEIISGDMLRFRADSRFKYLFNIFISNLRCGKILSEQDFIDLIDIEFIDNDNENSISLLETMRTQFAAIDSRFMDSSLQDFIDSYKNKEYGAELGNKAIPSPLFVNLTRKEKLSFDNEDYDTTCAFVLLNDNKATMKALDDTKDMIILHNFISGDRYPVFVSRAETLSFLGKYQSPIVFYSEDFFYVRDNIEFVNHHKLFFFYEGAFELFERYFLDFDDDNYIFYQQINDRVFFVFINEPKQSNIIFVTVQFGNIIEQINSDIASGKYTYINPSDQDSLLDPIFYKTAQDKIDYGLVISAWSNTKHSSDSEGHPWGERITIHP